MPPNMGSSLLTGTKKAEARGTRGRSRSVTQPAPTIDNTNTKPTRESLPPPPRVPAVEGSAATTRPRLKSAKNNNGNTNNSRTGRPSTLDTVQPVVDVSQSVSPVSPPTEKRSHSTTEKVFRREQNGRVSRHANSKDHASGQANPSPTPREAKDVRGSVSSSGDPTLANRNDSGTAVMRAARGRGSSAAGAAAAMAAAVTEAAAPAPPSPFRAPTRAVRKRPLTEDAKLKRFFIHELPSRSRFFRNKTELEAAMRPVHSQAALGVTSNSSASGSNGQAKGTGRRGRSGRNLGSAAVGSRRPASGSTGSRARGRISPSPARRGSAGSAVMASTATPTAGTGPEAEATSGSSGDKNGNSVPIPKFREHGLFETWDAEDCGQAGCSASEGGGEQGAADEPIASARVVRGARRKRFVAAGSAEARLGGGPMAPPLPPRGGVSAFSSVTAGASAAGLRSSSRRSGADTAGRGFTSDVGRDLPRDEELASPLQSLDPPRIMARPYVVTGSDYDVDDDDVKFLATLNAEASGGQWRGQQQSTVIGTDLFEDMIERLERQEDRARDVSYFQGFQDLLCSSLD